jgi:predicted DNA-binding protein (MmcQ/YjbR family)
MLWLQRTGPQTLKDKDLKGYIRESHRLVAAGLSKRVQKELGLGG